MNVTEVENDGLLRRTLMTVATMLGGAVVILGTASLIALFVTSKAVGSSSSPTAQITPAEGKSGTSGPSGAPAARSKVQKAPTAGNEI
ncbi:hypothetical protein [Pendulispora albinea]|uniref:Uncharacterized protein n=1 Tax=Pendulispora albinea TaxID=2741071 RepID=A0ABZ2LRD9_9BACT